MSVRFVGSGKPWSTLLMAAVYSGVIRRSDLVNWLHLILSASRRDVGNLRSSRSFVSGWSFAHKTCVARSAVIVLSSQ